MTESMHAREPFVQHFHQGQAKFLQVSLSLPGSRLPEEHCCKALKLCLKAETDPATSDALCWVDHAGLVRARLGLKTPL